MVGWMTDSKETLTQVVQLQLESAGSDAHNEPHLIDVHSVLAHVNNSLFPNRNNHRTNVILRSIIPLQSIGRRLMDGLTD